MTKMNCAEPISRVCRILSREGLLPNETAEKRLEIIKLTLHIIFFIVGLWCIILNGINAGRSGNSMALTHSICIFIPVANLFVKLIIVLQKKAHFSSLFDCLRSETFNNHSKELNKYVKYVYTVSELIWKYYAIVIGAYLFIVAILPFAVNIRMMIPPPFEMGKYVVLYKFIHIAMCVHMSLNSVCFDVLFMSLIGLYIAQLHILENKLLRVVEEAEAMGINGSPNQNCLCQENILKDCIILHETLSKCVDKLSVILSLPLFIQYILGCFIICNLVLQLTVMEERNTGNIISLIAYAGVTFSQMAVYHWLGNEIIFKSRSIIDACYMSKWYKLSRKSKQSLMILMERAKKPLVVQLYKLVFISLESLGVIVRWSYSLFAVIRARYN